MSLQRIKLTLAYIGTNFCGWQVQKNGPTIQGTLEEAITKICQQFIRVHGSGRTDAGVHALGQVAHFDIPSDKASIPWQKALNSLLPKDISVLKAEFVSENFHARYSAKSKTYTYTFWTEKKYVLPWRKDYVWPVGPLDMDLLKKASAYLLGEHDFKSFMNVGTPVKNTVRNVYMLEFRPGFYPQELVMSIRANGFLKQMVRNIAGLIKCIGKKELPLQKVKDIIHKKDRTLAPATAPAQGLCLEQVEY